MGYTSFYGGRKGASFIIVKSYPDIQAMTQDFSQGNTLTEVGFDEYVLINTSNKNHPDNGKIFKRGYDYSSNRTIKAYQLTDSGVYRLVDVTAGGAIYIGTIVGPAGRSPHIVMTTYTKAQQKHQGFDEQQSSGSYKLLQYENPEEDPGPDNPLLPGGLVPGKYMVPDEEGETSWHADFNDEIKWYCTSVRYPNNEDGTAYIGLEIPYLVVDYTTHSVEPYNENGYYTDASKAERIDNGDHPFYEEWDLSIPKGVKGDTLQNFKVIIPSEEDQILDFETQQPYQNLDKDIPIPEDFDPETYDPEDQTYEGYKPEDHPGRRAGGRKILVYDYYNYDEKNNPDKVTYYVGDYNEITDFSIDNYGTVTVAFEHNDTITYHQLMKYVTDITLDPETGHFIARYNTRKMIQNSETGQLEYVMNIDPETDQLIVDNTTDSKGYILDTDEFDLNWVKDIDFNQEDGDVIIHYTVANDKEIPNLIKWINDINITTQQSSIIDEEETQIINPEGTFRIKYNYGEDLVAYLKWVNNITLSNEGKLTLHYSGNGADKVISYRESNNNNQNGTFIKWINNVELNEFGTLTVTYNTGVEKEENGEIRWVRDKTEFSNAIKWITNINFDDNGNVIIDYNTGDSTRFDKLTKWIKDISLNTDTGVFQITYRGDPQDTYYSKQLKWPKKVNLNTNIPENSDLPAKQGAGNQKVQVQYTNGESEYIGNALNYIMQTHITEDRHLVVLYSDPEKRNGFMNPNNPTAYDFGHGTKNYEYNGYTGWYDLGSIYAESGVLVGLNIDPTAIDDDLLPDEPTQEQVIAYLNHPEHGYPGGLDGLDLKGKIVTVGIPGGEKSFYAFDYNYDTNNNYKGWYYLGAFTNVSAALSPSDIVPIGLQEDALWFVIQENYFVKYILTKVALYDSNNENPIQQKTVFDKSENCQMYLRGVNLSVSIMMNGVDVTNQYYNSSSGLVSIPAVAVTGDIVIQATGL